MAPSPAEVLLEHHSALLPAEALLVCSLVSRRWRGLAEAALHERRELRLAADFTVHRQTRALVELPALLNRMPGLMSVVVDPAHAHVVTHEHLLAMAAAMSSACYVMRFSSSVALADPTICGYTLAAPAALRPPRAEPGPHPAVDFESSQFLGAIQAAVQRGFQLWESFCSAAAIQLRALLLPPHVTGVWPEVDDAMGVVSNQPDNWERRLALLAALPKLSLFTLRDGYWLNLERDHLLSLAAALTQRTTQLRGLVLGPQEELDDDVVAALGAACPALEVFDASSPAIGPAGVASLLRACPKLTCLGAFSEDMESEGETAEQGDVRWSGQQWQAMLDALADARHLRALDLSGWHIPSAVAARLPGACARLTILGLGGVTLSDAAVAAFQTGCPSLCVIHLTCADAENEEEEEEEEEAGPGVSAHAIELLSATGVAVMGDQPAVADEDEEPPGGPPPPPTGDYWTPYWHRTVLEMWTAGLHEELKRESRRRRSSEPPSPSISR